MEQYGNEYMPDLFLEREELLECDMKTGNIKVDKQIFDDFVPNTYINIQFVEDEDDGIWQFSMVAEDDEGIFMEYLDYIMDEDLSYKGRLAKHSQPDPLDTWYGEE